MKTEGNFVFMDGRGRGEVLTRFLIFMKKYTRCNVVFRSNGWLVEN